MDQTKVNLCATVSDRCLANAQSPEVCRPVGSRHGRQTITPLLSFFLSHHEGTIMQDAKPATQTGEDLSTGLSAAHDTLSAAKLTRFERLKQKIKKLKGDDPDIYPMW